MEEEGMPIYVKFDEYDDILKMVKIIKDKIKDAKIALSRIEKIKAEEDAELEVWSNQLAEIENKVKMIDSYILEPR
ncbi:hypothetical protein D6745_01825 [Candidatus Woesearchaeota archaeon]|nr:MAG: hypothetical protein D6745_01825 [Candidatus Woesearchaeota archaeon]